METTHKIVTLILGRKERREKGRWKEGRKKEWKEGKEEVSHKGTEGGKREGRIKKKKCFASVFLVARYTQAKPGNKLKLIKFEDKTM